MNIRCHIVAAAAAAALLLLDAAPVLAHAQLRSATPAAGGDVTVPPTEVVLSFSEPLESAFSSVVVRDAVGKRVDKTDSHVDQGDKTTMRVSLPQLEQGIYIVQWRALTADTHRTEGAFIFRIGQ